MIKVKRKPKLAVIEISCKNCDEPMTVLKGSRQHKRKKCNLCIYAEKYDN